MGRPVTLIYRWAFARQFHLCTGCGRFLWLTEIARVDCGPNTANSYCRKCFNGARQRDPEEWRWAELHPPDEGDR